MKDVCCRINANVAKQSKCCRMRVLQEALQDMRCRKSENVAKRICCRMRVLQDVLHDKRKRCKAYIFQDAFLDVLCRINV